jgi:glycosyltransferase involved in cell wall biosynthesis
MTSAHAPSPVIPSPATPMRVLFALPGFHAVNRGAEVALESVALELAHLGDFDVTLIGSGHARTGDPYRFIHAGRVPRERFLRWPKVPILRTEYDYEEASFALPLWSAYRPADFDVTIGCSYPFTNWVLRRKGGKRRPPHVYVTQNGDWPCQRTNAEFKWFGCEGLVCTNPDYYETNRGRYDSVLIPNGVDPARFFPRRGEATDRPSFGLPIDQPVVIMVSALIPSKRVVEGIRAVAECSGVFLAVAGDGPLKAEVQALGASLLPGRFLHQTLPRERMPDFYRCADAFLHMSQDEPSANAYIEALATGLPVVTHDRPVTRWTFDQTAFLVDTSNPAAVATAITSAVHPDSAASARRIELVQRRYTWKGIAGQYAEFLRRVVDRQAELRSKQ